MNNIYKIYNEIQRLKKNEDQQELLKQVLSINDKTVLYNNVAFLGKVSKLFDNLEKIDPQNIQKIINNRNPEILKILFKKGKERPEYFKNIDFSPIINSNKPLPGMPFIYPGYSSKAEEIKNGRLPIEDEIKENDKKYIYSSIFEILKKNGWWNEHGDGSEVNHINDDFAYFLIDEFQMPKQHFSKLLDRPINYRLIVTAMNNLWLTNEIMTKILEYPNMEIKKLAVSELNNLIEPLNESLINKIKQIGEENFLPNLIFVQRYPISNEIMLKELKKTDDLNYSKTIISRLIENVTKSNKKSLLNDTVDAIIVGNEKEKKLGSFFLLIDENSSLHPVELGAEQQNKITNLLQKTDHSNLRFYQSFGHSIKWNKDNASKMLKILSDYDYSHLTKWLNNIQEGTVIEGEDINEAYQEISQKTQKHRDILYSNFINISNDPKLFFKIANDINSDFYSKKINFAEYLKLKNKILTKLENKDDQKQINNILDVNTAEITEKDLSDISKLSLESFSPSQAKNIAESFIDKAKKIQDSNQKQKLFFDFLKLNASYFKGSPIIDDIINDFNFGHNNAEHILAHLISNNILTDENYKSLFKKIDNDFLFSKMIDHANSDSQLKKINDFLSNNITKKDHEKLINNLLRSQEITYNISKYVSQYGSPKNIEYMVSQPSFFKDAHHINNILFSINRATHYTKRKILENLENLSDKQVVQFFENIQDPSIKVDIVRHPSISNDALTDIYNNFSAEDENEAYFQIVKNKVNKPNFDADPGQKYEHIYIHPAVEKLYNLKSLVQQSGGKVNKKELPNKGQGLPTQLFDKTGHLTTESIEKYIESLPKHKYGISWDSWDGGQRHSDMSQQVLQINITNDHMNKIKEHNLHHDYKFLRRLSYSSNHPAHEHTLGWARIDDSRPGHWHIDEIQSDFGQSIPAILDSMESDKRISKEEKEKKLDSYKKILSILCGPFKNINHAVFHAVHDVARKMGIDSLSMDEIIDQAKQSQMQLTAHIKSSEAYDTFTKQNPHPRDYEYKAVNHWASQNNLINKDGSKASKEEFEQKWKESHKDAETVELPVPLPVHMRFTYDQLPKEHGYEIQEKEKIFPKKDYSEQYLQFKKLIKSIIILLNNVEKYNYKLWRGK